MLDLFQIDKKTVSGIHSDENELLKFSFRWLQFVIFGNKTIKPKKGVLQAKKRAMGRR